MENEGNSLRSPTATYDLKKPYIFNTNLTTEVNNMIEIQNLSKSFKHPSGQIDILHNTSLTINKRLLVARQLLLVKRG